MNSEILSIETSKKLAKLEKENKILYRRIDMWNKFYNEEFEKIKKAINYNENCLNSLLALKRDTTLKYTEKDMINLAVTIHYEYLNILEGSDKE